MANRKIGDRLIELASVDSTNKYAAEGLMSGELAHGTVILAREQTGGRGQRGRIWKSASGLDIMLSAVLLPETLRAEQQFGLAKMAALAVHDVVAEALLSTVGLGGGAVRIKWPNDVLIDRRKVAGILIENELSGGLLRRSIIGIGINVNSSDLDAEFNATSLRSETGHPHELRTLVDRLLERLDHYWDLLVSGDGALAHEYTARLWSRGRFTHFLLDGSPISARPMDVDADGRLMIELEDGRVQAYGLERLRFGER